MADQQTWHPPREGASAGAPAARGSNASRFPEGGIQRLAGIAEAGLACQCMPPDKMQCWLGRVWAEHRIRRR
eukprot:7275879-Pyramimonas_sp.AAC.1